MPLLVIHRVIVAYGLQPVRHYEGGTWLAEGLGLEIVWFGTGSASG